MAWWVAFLLPLGVWWGYRPSPPPVSFSVVRTTNGWGYRIYAEKQLLIEQTHLPAVIGHVGFTDSLQAAKVAERVVRKIANGQIPTINTQELDSLIGNRPTNP